MQDLQVQCEAQVLLFVLDYVDSTQLEPAVAAQLFQHVSLVMHVPEIDPQDQTISVMLSWHALCCQVLFPL